MQPHNKLPIEGGRRARSSPRRRERSPTTTPSKRSNGITTLSKRREPHQRAGPPPASNSVNAEESLLIHTHAERHKPIRNAFHAAIFIDLLSVAMVVPFLPRHAAMLHVSSSKVGVVQAIYGACQLISTPVLGTLSDVYGTRVFILMSVCGTALAYLLLSWSLMDGWFIGFILSRMLIGCVRQTMSIGSAFIASSCRSKREVGRAGDSEVEETAVTRELAWFQSSASMGFVFGPALGGALGEEIGVAEVAAVAGLLDLCNLGLMWWATRPPKQTQTLVVPRTPRKTGVISSRNPVMLAAKIMLGMSRGDAMEEDRSPDRGELSTARRRGMSCLCFHSFANISLQMMLPIVANTVFQLSPRYVGMIISASSGVSALVLATVLPRVLARGYKAQRIAYVCSWVAVAGYLIIGVSAVLSDCPVRIVAFLFGHALLSFTVGVADVLNRSRFSSLFDKNQSGEVLSIAYSMDGCNRVLVPLVGGWLSDGVGPSSPLWLSAMASLASALLQV